jgi:hypothetical protein
MKNHQSINGLPNLRYHAKLCHNEDGDSWRLIGDSSERQMQFTYQELITLRKRELVDSPDADSPADTQVYRNNVSTLHSYLAFCGKTDLAVVGREMFAAFDEKLSSYLDALEVAPRTKSDRRSHLHGWRKAAAKLAESATKNRSEAAESSFHQLLRQSLSAAGYPPKTLAKKAGASPSAVQRWLKGAFPNRRAFPSVHRLEAELGLQRDALLSLLPVVASRAAKTCQSIAYRQRHSVNTQNRYRLRTVDMTPSFSQEWEDFFEYKTSRDAQLERSERGSWRVLPLGKIAMNVPPYARRGNRGCVTAVLTMSRIRAFLGYLSLAKEKGGHSIPPDQAQSLAWFTVPSAIEGFLHFLSDRAGGTVHGGHAGFCKFGASLTHARTGYLTQQPAFADSLPRGILRGTWAESCARAHKLYRQWSQDAKELSRKPDEPIQSLLNLSEPLAPLFRAIDQLDHLAAESAPGSLQEAVYKRDALLLAMLMANPLRARNYILMTSDENGAGNLYQRGNHQWRLRFGANDFKNDRHSEQRDYDAPLPSFYNDRIEEYLVEYRPRLLKSHRESALLFPNKNGEMWARMGVHFRRLTLRLIPETPGFGTHAVRHLVATDFLRKHPNDFLTAAQLLHDKLSTVLKAYAHLRQDDAFNSLEAHLHAVGHSMTAH